MIVRQYLQPCEFCKGAPMSRCMVWKRFVWNTPSKHPHTFGLQCIFWPKISRPYLRFIVQMPVCARSCGKRNTCLRKAAGIYGPDPFSETLNQPRMGNSLNLYLELDCIIILCYRDCRKIDCGCDVDFGISEQRVSELSLTNTC